MVLKPHLNHPNTLKNPIKTYTFTLHEPKSKPFCNYFMGSGTMQLPPYPGGKVLDGMQEQQNLQVNTYVAMLDNQQNTIIGMSVFL